MVIDIHTHITYDAFPEFSRQLLGRPGFTVATLLKRMDLEGIDQSVLLPLTNPENLDYFGVAGNQECLEAARKYPDRLIPFCNIDPRALLNHPKADLGKLMRVYKDLGCLGIGEVCANLSITDPRCWNLFHHAGCEGMPLLFHFASRYRRIYGVVDKLHFPGLEKTLQEFPETIFIGHGPAFWAEISADLEPRRRVGYPKGPVVGEGHLWHLLEAHPNLYGDLSAGSGCNALTRDPASAYRFLERLQHKLFFGTDRFTSPDEPLPLLLPFLKDAQRDGQITHNAYENITFRNFRQVILKGK